jgi:predicted nucleotidyltransferase component of viral defense system
MWRHPYGPSFIICQNLRDWNSIPLIKVYSKVSALSEKLEAIARRGITTSRMKDFFDILHLAANSAFDMISLKMAVKKTFLRRNIPIVNIGIIEEKNFKQSAAKQTQWEAFLRRNRLELKMSFSESIERMIPFVRPLYDETVEENLKWDNKKWRWRSNS